MSAVTVVPTVEAGNTPPRVRLDVTDAGSPNLFATTVLRNDPDGVQRPVRTPDGNPLVLTSRGTRSVTNGVTTASSTTVTSATANFTANDVGATISGGSIPAGSTIVSISSTTAVVISAAATSSATGVTVAISGPNVGLVYDYEAWFGAPTSYTTVESPSVVSAEVVVGIAVPWLIHPGVPSLSMPVDFRVGSLDEEQWGVQEGIFWPMGRKYPVRQTDGRRKAPSSSVTVAIESLGQLADLRALVSDAGVLLLNVPASLDLGVNTCYIGVGPIRNRRLSNIGSDPNRSVELPYQVVDRPAGGTQAERTLDDLSVYPTLNDLAAAYPTLLAVDAGP